MAMLPCTACNQRTLFRNSGAYCHLWGTGIQRDFRIRLCPLHLLTFQNDLAKYEVASLDDTSSVIDTPTDCFTCGKPAGQTDWHFSVTAYPAKNERKDYWARLHTDCSLPGWAQNGQPLL
jgi:hypothetical protein